MFSETDSYTVIIVRKLELKCDATKVEINDMRYVSCLPVTPTVMEATLCNLQEKTNIQYGYAFRIGTALVGFSHIYIKK